MNKKQLIALRTMTSQQKSVLLARAMGWEVSPLGSIFPTEGDGHIAIHPESSLYDPNEMALAWRCLRWVSQGYEDWRAEFQEWFASTAFELMGEEHAQRIWLDHVLKLAIDEGLIPLPIEVEA